MLCCCCHRCFNQCAWDREMKRQKWSLALDSPLNDHLYFHKCYIFKVLYNSQLLACSLVAHRLNLTTKKVKVLKYQVVSNVKGSRFQDTKNQLEVNKVEKAALKAAVVQRGNIKAPESAIVNGPKGKIKQIDTQTRDLHKNEFMVY